ncbi:hypothetical protein SEUCBS140593_006248, partial [Sporothrix eucalyptigena]
MSTKTWFLSPDFTFLPDGQISLGSIIPEPRRPTTTLASLADLPDIVLPNITSIVETGHSFSEETKPSFGFHLFARFLQVASAKTKTDVSWSRSKSFSEADHEVLTYNGVFTPETLKAIVALDEVKQHMNSGPFGKRNVYIISGIRVAVSSFKVTEKTEKKTSASLGGSGSTPAGVVPVELGVSISGGKDSSQEHSYETAPGIVFAYRLHIIRPKGAGGEAALFSDDNTALFTGQNEDEEEDDVVMEAVEVDRSVFSQDVHVKQGGYIEENFNNEDGVES